MSGISKLLFVSDAPHFGGAERYVANMVAAARHRGIESVVWWSRPEVGTADVFADARSQGADVRVVPPVRTRRLAALCHELRAVIRREQPQAMIINACGRPRFWAAPWVAWLEGIPSVWVHHMVDQHDYRRLGPDRLGGRVEGLHLWRWPQALRHRLAATASSAVIALNEQDRRQVAREHCIRPHRVAVVYNGIDTDQYRFDSLARVQARAAWTHLSGATQACSTSLEPFIVGSAGRLVRGKGFEMLIQAVAALRGRDLPIQVVVAGDGPDRELLSSFTRKLALSDAVRFLGHVEDMPSFYSGLDAFALCSSTESFGLVLGEAMACERAVVATPTTGARTQINHGLNGLVLDSFSADDLAECLQCLHASRSLREHLGHNARRGVIRNFSVDAALVRTLEVLSNSPAGVSRRQSVEMPAGVSSLSAMEDAA